MELVVNLEFVGTACLQGGTYGTAKTFLYFPLLSGCWSELHIVLYLTSNCIPIVSIVSTADRSSASQYWWDTPAALVSSRANSMFRLCFSSVFVISSAHTRRDRAAARDGSRWYTVESASQLPIGAGAFLRRLPTLRLGQPNLRRWQPLWCQKTLLSRIDSSNDSRETASPL